MIIFGCLFICELISNDATEQTCDTISSSLNGSNLAIKERSKLASIYRQSDVMLKGRVGEDFIEHSQVHSKCHQSVKG